MTCATKRTLSILMISFLINTLMQLLFKDTLKLDLFGVAIGYYWINLREIPRCFKFDISSLSLFEKAGYLLFFILFIGLTLLVPLILFKFNYYAALTSFFYITAMNAAYYGAGLLWNKFDPFTEKEDSKS